VSLDLDLIYSDFNFTMVKPCHYKIYEFEKFRLDTVHLMLYCGSEEIPLAPKAVETLLVLVERRGEILSKDELMETIWTDSIVEESNLAKYLHVLRNTLGNSQDGKPFIETFRRRGYRFNGDVRLVPARNGENGTSDSLSVIKPAELLHLAADVSRSFPDRPEIASPPLQNGRMEIPSGSQRWSWSPEGSWFAAAGAIAVIVVLAFTYSYFTSHRQIDSIAVMPFNNESGDAELEYLSDGMTETLIERLSKIPSLGVQARSSIFRYKGKDTDARTVASELGVQAVLYGRVAQRGDDLTFNAELVDGKTGNRLWAQIYNRRTSNLIALQGDVARDLVSKLSIKLSGSTEQKLAKNYTENAEAYGLFIKGRFSIRKLTLPEIKAGISYMERAIDIDPSYALAYAGISEGYRALAMAGEMPPGEVLPKAKAAAQKAVEIDDMLAEGHSALGFTIFFQEWNWPEAEKHLLRALELDPNNSTAHFSYGNFLGTMGRREEALAEFDRARELEPYDPFINAFGATLRLNSGQPEEAVNRIKATIDLDPNFYFSHMIAGGIYKVRGMNAESLDEYRLAKSLSPDQTLSDVGLVGTLIQIGKADEARAILKQMLDRSKTRFVPPFNIALVYAHLGETDKALEWLERGYQQRDPKMSFLKGEPRLKNLRDDPRFQDLMQRVGF
jgi:TolB-like protein/DNA-binding winged helix-turn-helix (wHTH) protein/Tfp pilus assembly protein PilF